jgi:hypothetical protein
MLSQQALSDRFEIQDLCYRYAEIIDSKDFDALRTDVFTPDAHIDYSVFGGSVGGLEETIAFLKDAMAPAVFPAHQHLNANIQVKLDGDAATGRVMCFNPQELAMPDGGTQLFMLGLWYVDSYRRTPDGWRISSRVEEKSWVFNTPDFMSL